MRSIQINFNSENQCPDGKCLGHKGEHNATELVITPPEEMLNSDKVECFVIAFQVGAHRLFRSDVHEKSETISYKIPREVTVANMIDVQLEGYDSEEELIVKSDVVENLYFNNSICGEETDGEVSKSLSGEIAANTAARHTHENADVLKNLADNNRTLTYYGNPIGVSTERPTATYESAIDGSSNMYAQEDGFNFKIAMMINTGEEPEIALIGKEVAKVEFKTTTGEWILLEETSEKDFNPLVVTLKHIIRKDLDDIDSIVFTAIYYPAGTGWLKQSITNYQITDVKVTYYTD